jgi:hypothetical protein
MVKGIFQCHLQEIERIAREKEEPTIEPGGENEQDDTGGDGVGEDKGELVLDSFQFPTQLESAEQLDELIGRLKALRVRFANYSKIIFGK